MRRSLLEGYPDRVARRRPRDPSLVVLASGRGARMGRESQVTTGDWMIALEVTSGPDQDAQVRVASVVDEAWLTPTATTTEHRVDDATGTVKAVVVRRYDAIVMDERAVAPDPDERPASSPSDGCTAEPQPQSRSLRGHASPGWTWICRRSPGRLPAQPGRCPTWMSRPRCHGTSGGGWTLRRRRTSVCPAAAP
ncbi:MAG: hypothetical protein R2712_27015 [Vicinamibacterales bacterium]